MLALGIDPGTAICGYGLVKLERSRLIPIHYDQYNRRNNA